MPPTVTLRDAVKADVPVLLRLVRDLADYERMPHRVTATETDLARMLFASPPRAHAMLAEAEQRPVGIAVWYYLLSTFTARPILFLEDIFVDAAYRGQGIGFAMFRRLATIARANNCLSMDWRVLNWNQPAINFYSRIGARPMTDWTVQRLDTEGLAALAEA